MHLVQTTQYKYKCRRKQADSVVSGSNAFVNFLTSVHRPDKRDTILKNLSRSWKTQLFDSMAESPTTRLYGPISTLKWLFKILKFSGPSLPGMTPSTLQPHFLLLGGGIMTIVIVISFACERKTVPNDYAPELLTRIVQSPTKLNDKI